MVKRGTLACRGMWYIVGVAQIASLALAETPPMNAFNVTLAATHDWNTSLFDEEEDGIGVSDLYELSAMQRKHDLISQTDRRGDTKRKLGKSSRNQDRNERPPNRQRHRRPNRAPNRPPNRAPQRNPGQSTSYSKPCFSVDTYNSIDDDIAGIKNAIRNDAARSHFLGGIVRLAAHDFLDFDRRDRDPMGPDGCYDLNHPNNAGLETIWCRSCALKLLYDRKYSFLSRADFWVASANAVIRQTSVRNTLDLKETFMWGRKDRAVCRGSGERLPQASSCSEVEDVFLRNMGLQWKDAVALLGAHTLGRGDRDFSGHHGTWVETDEDAQVFDKGYYEALFTNSWRPRNMGSRGRQDWTTGRGNGGNARMMLNTDMCLVFDIDEHVSRRIPCCSRTNSKYPDGQSQCVDREAARRKCPMYSQHDSRRAATDAVHDMLDGSVSSNNNGPFYIAFAKAWRKATTVGQRNLFPLQNTCERT